MTQDPQIRIYDPQGHRLWTARGKTSDDDDKQLRENILVAIRCYVEQGMLMRINRRDFTTGGEVGLEVRWQQIFRDESRVMLAWSSKPLNHRLDSIDILEPFACLIPTSAVSLLLPGAREVLHSRESQGLCLIDVTRDFIDEVDDRMHA